MFDERIHGLKKAALDNNEDCLIEIFEKTIQSKHLIENSVIEMIKCA